MAKSYGKDMNQHKRLACGGSIKGYARGGLVQLDAMINPPSLSQPANPLTMSRRNNGVPGMKAGGRVSKK